MKVLVFSADHYMRKELERLDAIEKYELANMGATLDGNCTVYNSLQEFEDDVNEALIYIDNSFIYFVNV